MFAGLSYVRNYFLKKQFAKVLPEVREAGNHLQLFKDFRNFFKELASVGANEKLDSVKRRVVDFEYMKNTLDKPAENTPFGIFHSSVKRMEKELLSKEDIIFNK